MIPMEKEPMNREKKKKLFAAVGLLLFAVLLFNSTGFCDEGNKGRIAKKIILYLPNRVLDAMDIVRLGVHVGPGIGLDARVTRFVQLAADTSADVGVAWQGRKGSPIILQVYNTTAIGPIRVGAGTGLRYRHTLSETSLTLNAGLVGFFAAYDSAEFIDFVLGWSTFDFKKDDWGRKKE
jgi:hypothetical protein